MMKNTKDIEEEMKKNKEEIDKIIKKIIACKNMLSDANIKNYLNSKEKEEIESMKTTSVANLIIGLTIIKEIAIDLYLEDNSFFYKLIGAIELQIDEFAKFTEEKLIALNFTRFNHLIICNKKR